jgi:hypothetical protein
VPSVVGPPAQLLTRNRRERAAPAQSLPRVTPHRILDRIRLLVRTLGEDPGLTSPELAERIGLGRRHTTLLLLRLEEHGHVVAEGRRWYPGPEAVE